MQLPTNIINIGDVCRDAINVKRINVEGIH